MGWTSVERDPPSHDADPLDHLLFRQHHVISRRQALRVMSHNALRHRVTSGRWQQPMRSVYVAMTGPIALPQRRWIGVLASRGPLAAFSALEVLGLKGYGKPYTEVLITANRRVRPAPPETVIRRTASLPVTDVLVDGLPPVMVAARSLVDAAQWARDDAEATAVVAAAFQQRLVVGDEVLAVLARLQGVRREALIRQAVEDARGGSHSISEVQFLQLCRRNGLPDPSRQVVRRDSRGRKRYRDALFEEWGFTSRSTAPSTWRCGPGPPTWPSTMRSRSRASGCSGSPPGSSAVIRRRSSASCARLWSRRGGDRVDLGQSDCL
ncbi:DUF559 domain-containing protein [Dactylosporangium cerinum]